MPNIKIPISGDSAKSKLIITSVTQCHIGSAITDQTIIRENFSVDPGNSHIINIKEVKKMVKSDGGYAVMNDDSMINISPKKKDEFMLQMSQRLV